MLDLILSLCVDTTGFHGIHQENNLDLYLQSLHQLCGLMFSGDHLYYADDQQVS